MKGKYGVAASCDSLRRDFYTLIKEEKEKVPQFFFGLKKEIRDSIRFRCYDPNIPYSEPLRFAKETEVD